MGTTAIEPLLVDARADLDRARSGHDMTEQLIAHGGRLAALPWSNERYAVEQVLRLALLAGSTRDGLRHVVTGEIPIGLAAGSTIQGILLRDYDPLTEPFAENPWGIGTSATLAEAIERVWEPVEEHATWFLSELRARTLGLVLLRNAATEEPMLAYLLYHELDAYSLPEALKTAEKPAFDRRLGLAWEPFGDISMFVGRAPAKRLDTKAGIVVPEPLATLYAVHGGMQDGMWSLSTPKQLLLWNEMLDHVPPRLVNAEADGEEILSEELLHFFSYGDDRSDLFDLSRGPGEPRIRAWGDGMLYAGQGEYFWEWFEEKPPLFLKFPAD